MDEHQPIRELRCPNCRRKLGEESPRGLVCKEGGVSHSWEVGALATIVCRCGKLVRRMVGTP